MCVDRAGRRAHVGMPHLGRQEAGTPRASGGLRDAKSMDVLRRQGRHRVRAAFMPWPLRRFRGLSQFSLCVCVCVPVWRAGRTCSGGYRESRWEALDRLHLSPRSQAPRSCKQA